MIHNLIILVALLMFILTFYISRGEGFYDPIKEDQRPFGMDNHTYDGDLFQAEKILYDMINKMPDTTVGKDHLSELLNLLQFI